MTKHEEELLKRWGFPALILLVVALVWWYYKAGSASTVVSSNIPNTSQSGVPTYNFYGASSTGGGGTAATNTPTLPVTTATGLTPQTVQPSAPLIPQMSADPTSANITRLTHNFPNAFGQPTNVVNPNTPCGGSGSGCGCDSCASPCGGGSASYNDSSSTIVAASPAQQNLQTAADGYNFINAGLLSASMAGVVAPTGTPYTFGGVPWYATEGVLDAGESTFGYGFTPGYAVGPSIYTGPKLGQNPVINVPNAPVSQV